MQQDTDRQVSGIGVARRFSLFVRALIRVALILGALTGHLASASQTSYPMRFEHLTLDHGLSQSNVLSVWQDADGMMWFGTENGLNRFDGYRFKWYTGLCVKPWPTVRQPIDRGQQDSTTSETVLMNRSRTPAVRS